MLWPRRANYACLKRRCRHPGEFHPGVWRTRLADGRFMISAADPPTLAVAKDNGPTRRDGERFLRKVRMRKLLVCFVGLLPVATGCNRLQGIQSKGAVEEAIYAHLKQNPHLALNSFTTQIEGVRFSGDTAEARVKFRSKQSAKLAVEVRYVLRREGSRWEVVSSSPVSGQGMNTQDPRAGRTRRSHPSSDQAPIAPMPSH